MQYSADVQARLNAKNTHIMKRGLKFPMPRVQHNGETGEWVVREVDTKPDAKFENVEEKTVFETTDGAWTGVVLRVAFMSQTKYKEGASFNKFTREFTDWKNEPIELLKKTFGPEGKTETLKTFKSYGDFKLGTLLKDEDGNPAGSAFDLKVCLYVYHLQRKQVVKLVVGGSTRSEWFGFNAFKPLDPEEEKKLLSRPWKVQYPNELLEQLMVEFRSTEAKTDKGMEYHRLSFHTDGFVPSEVMGDVLDMSDKVAAWVESWKVAKAASKPEGASLEEINAQAPLPPAPPAEKPDGAVQTYSPELQRKVNEMQEIRVEDIPF